MLITERPAVLFTLGDGRTACVATRRWELERWQGEPDPPELEHTWARKPGFSVGGRCLRAEFVILNQLRLDGWHGVWVNAYRNELRPEWFPAPAVRTLAGAGAPDWAVRIFDELRAANGGKLSGFFDVFAWREPGEVRFDEAKVGTDRIRPSQRRFLETALRFHRLDQFSIIEIPR
jgi:hypothetical protein